jgi:hypothetical protein
MLGVNMPVGRRRGAVVAALAVAAALVAGLVVRAPHAGATPVGVAGCGSYDFDPGIYLKYVQLGGAGSQLGCPVRNGAATADGRSVYMDFAHGSIYWLKWTPGAAPVAMLNPLRDKWASLGWEGSVLGYPTGDTSPIIAPDSSIGLAQTYERGIILWSQPTGAHELHGNIWHKYETLDRNKIGFPTSDEQPFPDSGRVNTFQHGGIYWWPDTGAIPIIGRVSVDFIGLKCFEKQEGGLKGSDEIYGSFGLVWPGGHRTVDWGFGDRYSDVDEDDYIHDRIPLYTGDPLGLDLSSLLMEHDEGDPAKYQGAVKTAVGAAATGLTAAVGALAGPGAAVAAGGLLAGLSPAIVSAVNDLLGTDDDRIGSVAQTLTAKQLVLDAVRPMTVDTAEGTTFKERTVRLTGAGANYKLYFDVRVV